MDRLRFFLRCGTLVKFVQLKIYFQICNNILQQKKYIKT